MNTKISVKDFSGNYHSIYYFWQMGKVKISVDSTPYCERNDMADAERTAKAIIENKGWNAETAIVRKVNY